MFAIELADLTKQYGAEVVVNQLSFQVPQGQSLALLGPNGAGKTTTIKMICGLITPSAGTIQLWGQVKQHRALMPRLGVVLEGSRNIYWRLSAWDNLIYFAHLKGVRVDAPRRAYMEYLLKRLDLWDKRREETRNFSRGMQQKVALACALVTDPDLILLDEPTLGLDVQAYGTIVEFVKELHRNGKTLLITSHDFDFIGEIAERVLVMKQKLVFSGTPHDLARMHGGSHQIQVTGFHEALTPLFVEQWRIRPNGEVTILTGSGAIYATLAQLQAHGCTLKGVQEISLNAEVFLDLLGEEAL